MSAARTAILARVRAAQRTAVLPAALVQPFRAANDEAGLKACATSVRMTGDQFTRELQALSGEVTHAQTADEVQHAVRERTAGLRVLAWDDDALPYRVFEPDDDVIRGAAPRDQLAAAQIGVTGCDAAIAETGSLVLLSGKGRSRAVSLLPPIHLALVRRSVIVSSLVDAWTLLGDRLDAAACCTLITGPSRTADIELTLTLGIHGPGRVIVVIGP